MIAFSAKKIAAATLVMGLAAPTLACVEFSGYIDSPLGSGGSLKSVDNGVQTCSGNIESGDKNLDCISGYSLNYDYTDNSYDGPMPVTYCNPSNCYGVNIPFTPSGESYSFDYSAFCH
ncbi:hypothetical protein N7537_010819 [Penicillium hordei]|uniref:Uncharacterized protein n=1 Tax=Penicillium hordei TaxID=40994 RepID=A0AAD6DL07_9EURO|nr:uncharacterized protein N7537_010819 [Penicillium hordei]KAJ5588141.1 hypothetical protein N7537_010819 [Penicillium hordei]